MSPSAEELNLLTILPIRMSAFKSSPCWANWLAHCFTLQSVSWFGKQVWIQNPINFPLKVENFAIPKTAKFLCLAGIKFRTFQVNFASIKFCGRTFQVNFAGIKYRGCTSPSMFRGLNVMISFKNKKAGRLQILWKKLPKTSCLVHERNIQEMCGAALVKMLRCGCMKYRALAEPSEITITVRKWGY